MILNWEKLSAENFNAFSVGREDEPQRFGCLDRLESCLSEAARRLSRWGSVRGCPVLSSHFSPGLAPQVGHRTASACFSVTCFMVCVFLDEGWSILTSAFPSYVLNFTGTRWDTIVEDNGESELYESVERTSYIFFDGIAVAEEAWSLANSRAKSKFFGNSAASSVSWACASSVFFSRRLASASKIFANGLR